MNGLNLNFSNENPLAAYLRPYLNQNQPQQQTPPEEPQRQTQPRSGVNMYEINSKGDIEYIQPDTSGALQIFVCQPENRIYTARYNHAKKAPDYRAYIDEGDVSMSTKTDSTEDLTKITEALFAVATRLEALSADIAEIKAEPKAIEPLPKPGRGTDGKFKKAGAK